MPLVPPFIEALSPYLPGKPIEETEREFGVSGVVKLASNENPLGPSPKARAAVAASLDRLHLYPDGASFSLRQRLAEEHSVTPAEVMLGAGSNELIELLVRTFVHGDEELLLASGSFLMYRLSAQAAGRTVVEIPMRELRYDLPAMARAVTPRTKLVFVANPDNPTGSHVGLTELSSFLDAVGPGPLVVLDEAYIEYVTASDFPDSLALRAKYPNLVTLRTFSKIHGLAGLRLGYGIARRELTDYVNRTRMPFNISAVAQAAGFAALDDREHVARTRALNGEGLALLSRELPGLGLTPAPTQANFVLADFHRPVAALYEPLLRAGVIVRPMGGYGLPNCARINTGLPEDHRKLLAALKAVL